MLAYSVWQATACQAIPIHTCFRVMPAIESGLAEPVDDRILFAGEATSQFFRPRTALFKAVGVPQ